MRAELQEGYGAPYLVAESIGNPADVDLIAQAPALLAENWELHSRLEEVVEILNSLSPRWKVQASPGGNGFSIYEGYQTVAEGLEFAVAQRIADVHNRSVDEGELVVSISDFGI